MKTNQKTFAKWKSVAMIPMAAMCFGSVMAYADYETATITTLLTKKSYVLSNGEKYTSVKPFPIATADSLSANVHFTADAGLSGKVKSWKTWLEIHSHSGPITFPIVSYEDHSFSKSYARRDRPKNVNRTELVMVPRAAFNNLFTAQCNVLAQNLRNQGLSNQDIFSVDRNISYQLHASASASYTGLDNIHHFVGADNADKTAEIVCMKAPTPQVVMPTELQINTGVTDATLNIIEQSTLSGACKINLSTTIRTNLQNTTVKYRYEHIDGKKSDIKTVKTNHAKIAMDAHWYDIPNNPNESEAGSVRIIGVSHDFESSWKSYNMSCNEASPNSLSLVTKPTIQISLQPTNNVMYQGKLCPTKVKVTATLTSQQVFSGTGVVTMKQSSTSFASHDVNLSAGTTWHHYETFDLKPWSSVNSPVGNAGGSNTWQTQPSSGVATVSQRFELRYALSANNQNVVTTPYKTISISCTTPQINSHVLPSNNAGVTAVPKPNDSKLKNYQLKALPVDVEKKNGPSTVKPLPVEKKKESSTIKPLGLKQQTLSK